MKISIHLIRKYNIIITIIIIIIIINVHYYHSASGCLYGVILSTRSIFGYLIKNRGSNGSSKKIIPNILPPLSCRLFDGPCRRYKCSPLFKLGCIRRYFSIGGFISTRNNAWGLSGFHLSSFMNTQPSITALSFRETMESFRG